MTRRSWMLTVVMLSLTVGGVWAGLVLADAQTTKTDDCCLDPTCPPGCCDACPPDCFTGAKASVPTKGVKATCKKAVTKEVDCCDCPGCYPGCCDACPPDCAESGCPLTTITTVAKKYLYKYIYPLCPCCPG